MEFFVRRLAGGEAKLHRNLRLAALRDSPDSFLDTFEQAQAQPESYWDEFTRSVTEPDRNSMFIAIDDEPVGSAYGLVDTHRTDMGRVGGLWVAPAARRRGVGRALLNEVRDWARVRGFVGLRLWAGIAPRSAIALYRSAGFAPTGASQPMAPNRPLLQIVEMELLFDRLAH